MVLRILIGTNDELQWLEHKLYALQTRRNLITLRQRAMEDNRALAGLRYRSADEIVADIEMRRIDEQLIEVQWAIECHLVGPDAVA